jgi:hypothetical protein
MGLAATGLVAVLLAAAQPADRAAGAAKTELAGPGYQTDLPLPAELPADDLHAVRYQPADAGGPVGVPSSLANLLLWATGAVAIGLVALWLGRELLGFAPAPAGGADPGAAADARAAVVQRPLDDAEALARAGRFGEAVHVLLLRTLEALAAHTGVPRSFTSREILRRIRLSTDAHDALAGLVVAVEVSHFGGQPPGETEFAACRARFHRFARAYAEAAR